MQLKDIIFSFSLLGLVACGGSGSSNEEPASPVASINAGADQTVNEKSSIVLSGLATPAGGEFVWKQLSGPILAGFPASGATQTVVAPSIKLNTQLIFELQYTTSDKQVLTDTMTVSVTAVNQLPIVSITQTEPAQLPSKYNDSIVLSSENSVDPDEDGSLEVFRWQQTAGQALTISDFNSASLTFKHPLLEQDNQVQFSLTITDDEGGSQTNFYDLLLRKTTKVIAVQAGEAQTALEFATVTLDASQSQVLTESFSCYWQQTQGLTMSLIDANLCQARFIVPDIDVAEQLSFSVVVTDSKSRSDSGQTQVNIQPIPLGFNNDSGVAQCFDNTQVVSCGDVDFPGQDAEIGRDVVSDYLDKVGAGNLAFDFTKLDEFADELPDSATNFSCVRDNVTGLIWEVKQANTGLLPNTQLREGQNHYTWFFTGEGNGGVEGVAGAANSTCPSGIDCGIETYVNQVNALNFCGANNWRIPTYNELIGIMDLSQQGTGPLLDNRYFPNAPSYTLLDHLRYWTRETSVDGQSLSVAWILDFQSGNDLAYPKEKTAYIRLVRQP